METPPWYVLTGTICSGKSELIKELMKVGYNCVPEVARTLIDEYETIGISSKELRKDESKFQQMVLERKLGIEEQTPKNQTVFFDRGVPDSIAYFEICGLLTDDIKTVSRDRYRKVYFLERLIFKKDYVRVEDEATIIKLNRLLLKSYKDLGYEIVYIQEMPVDERLKIILSSL